MKLMRLQNLFSYLSMVRRQVHAENGSAYIGRLAVRREFRGQRLGATIMIAAENTIRKAGFKTCGLSAQVQARPFYESLGYKAEGDEYLDEDCPHIFMRKVL